MIDKIDVLDHGYVRLVNHMGTDLDVANAARVSFAKESSLNEDGTLKLSDAKLIKFLWENGHTSPFRHCFLTFEVKAPLLVARQWWRYVVGSDHTMDGWNEVSRRYVQDDLEFYIPEVWRSAPENKKQGSGGPVGHTEAQSAKSALEHLTHQSMKWYNQAIDDGICIEQARLLLPAYAMYTMWRWSASLQSTMHFLSQRLGDGAQAEIQEYAKAVKVLVEPLYPYSLKGM